MTNHQTMEQAVAEIKEYFKQWLAASNLTEESFFMHRTCKKYTLVTKECMQDGKEGIAVFLTHGKDIPIGLPFWIGYDNSPIEKEQFFLNTPLLLTYIAGQLDKKNQKEPVNGSYIHGYFMLKTKAFLPKFLEYKQMFVSN